MNRFRTKKRAKDDASAPETSSRPSFKSFRRGKKSTEEEPKPEFDLAVALPSDDNFRTSLLMTNLSARFSMLREQDDPNSKIGKASDDSVLFPKRQSRLADFGFSAGLGGLSDIAEVESIKAPFLRGQVDSYISDDADSTQGGSIMNRGKPTEGNILFGGRQKIYKIPVGGSSSAKTGMSGRALYEDDVAVSAFQLWRQTEKRRASLELDNKTPLSNDQDEETEPLRSESPPPLGYSRRRETSSTTSSASALARNSSAATSITSQRTTSGKDSHPASTAPSSTTSTPVLERSVTRTRRLYEQALTQDMHEQQSSALSRIDTLSRQRPIGNRTPDLAQVSPSPTNLAFHERFAERRPVLAKASAPNLRSWSPPTTASSSGTLDLGIRAPGPPDTKTSFGGEPPLSPPISETGDHHPMLPIQPNDRGKATAMGVFQKPAEPYDESKYAQRQLQLQQGRETPTQRMRAESNASFATTGRSRSSSSMQRQPFESKTDASVRIEPPVKEEFTRDGTFLDDSDDSAANGPVRQLSAPQLVLQRPADRDHPAFRESSLATPLSFNDRIMEEPSSISEEAEDSPAGTRQGSPSDSPTLGPTAGLSGIVRQHLRSESDASSVYGAAPQTSGLDGRFPVDPHDSVMEGLGASSNPWSPHGQEWNLANTTSRSVNNPNSEAPTDYSRDSTAKSRISSQVSSDDPESETDEFASQLADARRRVRERLTSYVETDSSREGSPLRHSDSKNDLAVPPSQANPLGIGVLKPKSSRGSLIDRSRTMVGSQSKAMKMLGIGAATMTTSPSPSKQSFDEKDAPLVTMQEEISSSGGQEDKTHSNTGPDTETESKSFKDKEDDNIHPGLKLFRQARREQQRRKELETLARHQASQASQLASERADETWQAQPSPAKERTARQRTPSRERKPPPILYQQRAPSEESRYGRGTGSQPSSRQTSTERNRSGSESTGGRSNSRQARLRNNSNAYDDQQQHSPQLGPNMSRPPMLRSPGLPGADIRRSPIMPSQGYPGPGPSSAVPSPHYLKQSNSATNLTLQHHHAAYEPSYLGQPSPISPLNGSLGLPAPSYATGNRSGSTTPTTGGPSVRRPSAPPSPAFNTTASTMHEPVKRNVSKNEISEPTLIMSTSRVPTVNLPNQPTTTGSTRSRSGTVNGPSAPPLPPINPLRKRENSGTRGAPGQYSAPQGDGLQDKTFSNTRTPNPPASGTTGDPGRLEGRSRFHMTDGEDNGQPDHNRRQRKAGNGDAHSPGLWAQGQYQRGPNQFVAAGPPASRTVLTPGLKPSHSGVPGGMF